MRRAKKTSDTMPVMSGIPGFLRNAVRAKLRFRAEFSESSRTRAPLENIHNFVSGINMWLSAKKRDFFLSLVPRDNVVTGDGR